MYETNMRTWAPSPRGALVGSTPTPILVAPFLEIAVHREPGPAP